MAITRSDYEEGDDASSLAESHDLVRDRALRVSLAGDLRATVRCAFR